MQKSPFDPVALSKIANMELRARVVADAVMSGIHKSPYTGSSIEFLEHKEYSPGNEIKHIDWKVQAKTDKYYVKQFEEETNLKSYLFIDASGSMGYKSTGVSKFEYAVTLIISLAYILLRQSDIVGLISFDDKVRQYIPPRSRLSHLHGIINLLSNTTVQGKSNIGEVLKGFAEKIGRRSLIIIVSDFFDDTQKILKQLKYFHSRKNEVVLFHILDPYELTFPFETITFFESIEDDKKILADPKSIKEQYLSEINRFITQFKQSCLENQIDYWLIDSSTPVDQALIQFLAKRESTLRPFIKI